MEYEIRFYYPIKDYEKIIQRFSKIQGLERGARCYEKTGQFDHPAEEYSFYTKEVDGRFRVRITKNPDDETQNKCKLSWKRRLPDTRTGAVNREEEVELKIEPQEYENLLFITNEVLKMKPVESYERYRTTFENDEIEIAVDEYPFGVAVEIEAKKDVKNPEAVVKKWANELGLDIKRAFRLSWDDKYRDLCQAQGIKQLAHVTFDAKMPEVK